MIKVSNNLPALSLWNKQKKRETFTLKKLSQHTLENSRIPMRNKNRQKTKKNKKMVELEDGDILGSTTKIKAKVFLLR